MIARGKTAHPFSRDELLAMTNIGERSGHIEEQEAKIIRNLIKFSTLEATDIMTPRTVVTALHISLSVSDALKESLDHAFSRLPVFGSSMDDIIGVVLKDDILAFEAQSRGDAKLDVLKRDIKRVPASISLPNLLELFLNSRQHIALVEDAFGGTKGIVTLEDVIEALLGMEIMDEMDNVEDMRVLARRQWQARAEKLGIDVDALELNAEGGDKNLGSDEEDRSSSN